MIALLLALVVSGPAFQGCPAHGDNPTARIQRLDLLKNRSTAPAKIDPSVTLKAMLAPGNDLKRWSDDTGATITGYVIKVKPGGLESVNCHAHSEAHRDTHIEIAMTPTASSTQAVIVEVTPYWRAKMKARGVDWSTPTLEKELTGKCVKITGWLFLDAEHENASETDNPGNPHDWRGTAWEVHPVTAITVGGDEKCHG